MENKELDALEMYVLAHKNKLREASEEHGDAYIVITLRGTNEHPDLGEMSGSKEQLERMLSRAFGALQTRIFQREIMEHAMKIGEVDGVDLAPGIKINHDEPYKTKEDPSDR